MISIEEAQQRILATVQPMPREEVPVGDALGRVVAEEVRAGVCMPPWDNSAMDGYAVRASDTSGAASETPARLILVETIAAGRAPQQRVGPGQAAAIMTGAPMPAGADAVVVVEDTDGAREGEVSVYEPARVGRHIRREGEVVQRGDTVAHAGQVGTPGRLALLAAVGVATVSVARQPRVALLGTGDEVVPPGTPLGPGQIYSSNNVALAAQVRQAGGVPEDHGTVADDPHAQRRRLEQILQGAPDLVLTTGGVSVGQFDHVKGVMGELGVAMDFWKVRMKPGKPLAFGTIGAVPLFGLPGNPVSCMVNFLQFVRPWMRRALGDPAPFLPVVEAVAGEDLSSRPGRARLERVTLSRGERGWVANSTGLQSSGAVVSMARAHGLLCIGADARGPREGERCRVQLLDPSFLDGDAPDYGWPTR